MAGREPALGDELLEVAGKLEQAEEVRDGGAVFAGAMADLVVAEVKFACEAFESQGGFDGVEVLALDVLDEGDFEEAVVGEFLNDDGDFGHSGELGGAPAAFAGHELVAVAGAADHEGLDDAVGADGLGEFLQAVVLEDAAGL